MCVCGGVGVHKPSELDIHVSHAHTSLALVARHFLSALSEPFPSLSQAKRSASSAIRSCTHPPATSPNWPAEPAASASTAPASTSGSEAVGSRPARTARAPGSGWGATSSWEGAVVRALCREQLCKGPRRHCRRHTFKQEPHNMAPFLQDKNE